MLYTDFQIILWCDIDSMLLRDLCDTDMVWVKKVTFAATPICAAIL